MADELVKSMFSLKDYNTFGIAAQAKAIVRYTSVDELQAFVWHNTEPLLVIGEGSNLLFLQDFKGIVLKASNSPSITNIHESSDGIHVDVWAGMKWDEWVAHAIERGWYGLENLSLIPGDVGAAAVQNIGAYGAEVKEYIEKVEAVNLKTAEVVTIPKENINYAYRSSKFKREWKGLYGITRVTFRLNKTFVPHLEYGGLRQALLERHTDIATLTAQELRSVIIEIRKAKLPDPAVLGNAGSFFMNPIVEREKFLQLQLQYPLMPHYEVDEQHVKIPAGWLIEQCGWKGKKLGKVGVYEKQALVLVNHGGATGADILHLCETIQQDVFSKFGINIYPEVEMV